MTIKTRTAAYAVGVAVCALLSTAQATAADAATSATAEATARPAFSPVAGGYSAAQTVTMTDKSPGATIYFTTNGTTPTTASRKYTKPITLTGTTTFKAIGVAGGVSSAVTTAAYVIDLGAVPVADGNVYSNGHFSAGIVFDPFGGSTNSPAPAPDPTTLFTDGSPALKITVCGSGCGYSGGAFVASKVRSLTAANALTFWAKASQNQSTLKVQLGNDAGAGANLDYQVESIGIPLTTSWQQYFIPLPDPSKAASFDGLASFADGPNNYTFWLADVEYATVSSAVLGKATLVNSGWPAISIAPGPANAFTISPAPNSVIWTGAVPQLPNGQNLDNVGWRWYTLTSDNPSVATVSVDGVVTGVAPGVAHITGSIAGLSVPGQSVVTVTAPLQVPTTYAPTPTLPANSVTALFDSSGVYAAHPVDSLDQPNFCSAVLTNPYPIAGGNGVLQYKLNACVGITFGDGEAGNTTNTINASAYTRLHLNVWSPNPDDLQIQLINNADPGPADIGIYDAGVIAANGWVTLDIPFASFTGANGLTAENALQQMLFVSSNPGMVLYVDNLYFH